MISKVIGYHCGVFSIFIKAGFYFSQITEITFSLSFGKLWKTKRYKPKKSIWNMNSIKKKTVTWFFLQL